LNGILRLDAKNGISCLKMEQNEVNTTSKPIGRNHKFRYIYCWTHILHSQLFMASNINDWHVLR